MVENNYLCWQVTCKSIYMRVSLLLFCIFSLFSSLSRGSSIPFSPIVRSYSVSDYNAGIQNWSIAQDDRGVMYIGNNKGLLEFLLLLAGTLLLAFAVKCIYEPLDMVTGGFSGLAILIKAVTEHMVPGGIPLGVSSLLLNIPVFLWAFWKKGIPVGENG